MEKIDLSQRLIYCGEEDNVSFQKHFFNSGFHWYSMDNNIIDTKIRNIDTLTRIDANLVFFVYNKRIQVVNESMIDFFASNRYCTKTTFKQHMREQKLKRIVKWN